MPSPPWGQNLDYNLMHRDSATNAPATRMQKQSGRDEHSMVADALFMDPAKGDYRVKQGSHALALGFVNFPMDRFGVQRPALKAIARSPVLPGQKPVAASGVRDTTPRTWLGASVRNVADMGEMSALGLPGVTGVLVLEVPAGSALAKCGLQKSDVILSVNGTKTADVATLLQQAPALAHFQSIALGISRQQKERLLTIAP
jgi:membrane-associated protease RseP (regulator of RpoE activity)